jgi:hypothetical protein
LELVAFKSGGTLMFNAIAFWGFTKACEAADEDAAWRDI